MFDNVAVQGHIFPVAYGDVDRELAERLAQVQPHALLMFGLAGRSKHVRIETRARNVVSTRWPAADGSYASAGLIKANHDALRFGVHTGQLWRAAKATGVDARLSFNAGNYLCNYLSWRGIEATQRHGGPRVAAFVHVPPVRLSAVHRRKGTRGITLDHLVDAGEAILVEMVKFARRG